MATAPITSSPDPRCTLDLSVLPRDLWTFRVLPIIKTHDDLMASHSANATPHSWSSIAMPHARGCHSLPGWQVMHAVGNL